MNGLERADLGLRGRANHGLELAERDGVEADLLGGTRVSIWPGGEEGTAGEIPWLFTAAAKVWLGETTSARVRERGCT